MGELAALASAATWAGTSTALARLGGRYHAPVLSAMRLLVATPLLIAFLVADGSASTIEPISLPVFAMVASGVVGYGLGDTAYIRTLAKVGIQRLAPTTTAAWVALSAIGGILLLDEPATWGLVFGGVAIIAGCFLIVQRAASAVAEALPGEWSVPRTVAAIMVVAGAWTGATLLLAGGRGDLSTAAAGAIRIPVGGLVVGGLMLSVTRGSVLQSLPRGHDLALISAVGIFGTGIGSWLYIYAVAEAGAARAVILNSTSPLMAIVLAMVFLHERLTPNTAVGTALCVAGTLVVVTS